MDLLLINFFIIAGAVLVILAIAGPGLFPGDRYKLPQVEDDMKKIKLHSFIAGIFPFSRKLLEKLRMYTGLKYRIEMAHLKLSAIEFFNIQIICVFVFVIVAFFALGKPYRWALPIAALLGYIIPEIWLRKKVNDRKYAIVRILPETVDLLGLCIEAGLDFTMAVKWVIEKTSGNPMIEELRFVLEEIKWGKSRSQALKDMSKRLNMPEISSFTQTLVQAERMGTPITEAFMILSEDTRLQRFHRGERFAMQAPIKILVPLIFCILPVIGIVVGGPILLQFMQNKLF